LKSVTSIWSKEYGRRKVRPFVSMREGKKKKKEKNGYVPLLATGEVRLHGSELQADLRRLPLLVRKGGKGKKFEPQRKRGSLFAITGEKGKRKQILSPPR